MTIRLHIRARPQVPGAKLISQARKAHYLSQLMHFLYRADKRMEQEPGHKHSVRPIRWRAFWRGSVYANPVNDFFGVLLDLTTRASVSPEPAGKALKIHFSPEAILIEQPDESSITYRYEDIRHLKIEYYPVSGGFLGNKTLDNINFLTIEGLVRYPFVYDQAMWQRTCGLLLSHRIPFKEFMGGTRAHLGRAGYSYQDIQRLKKELGIVW